MLLPAIVPTLRSLRRATWPDLRSIFSRVARRNRWEAIRDMASLIFPRSFQSTSTTPRQTSHSRFCFHEPRAPPRAADIKQSNYRNNSTAITVSMFVLSFFINGTAYFLHTNIFCIDSSITLRMEVCMYIEYSRKLDTSPVKLEFVWGIIRHLLKMMIQRVKGKKKTVSYENLVIYHFYGKNSYYEICSLGNCVQKMFYEFFS